MIPIILRRVSGVILLLALFSCASNDEKKKQKEASLVDFERSIAMRKQWTLAAGNGQDKRYANLVPAVVGNTLYVSDVDGQVFAYDLESKKRLWKTNVGRDISSSVGVYGTSLYLGTYQGSLLALNADSGEVLWESKTSSEVLGLPVANDSVAIAQTVDGRLFAFDVASGALAWRYDHIVPSLTLRGTADPVISRSQLLAGFGNGQIVSLNVNDGALVWSGRVAQPKGNTELEKMVDVDSTPIAEAGLVYAVNYHGALVAFSQAKGQAIWKQDVSSFNDIAVANGNVYVVDEDSHVIAYNTGNGGIAWKNEQMHLRKLGSILAFDKYLAVIDGDDYLHVLNQSDGSFAYRFKPRGDGFRSSLKAYGRKGFLVLSNDGKLSAYQIKE